MGTIQINYIPSTKKITVWSGKDYGWHTGLEKEVAEEYWSDVDIESNEVAEEL